MNENRIRRAMAVAGSASLLASLTLATIVVPAAAGGDMINVPRGDEIPADHRILEGDRVIGGSDGDWVADNAGFYNGGRGNDGAWGNASTGTFIGGPGDDYLVVNDGVFIGGPGYDWVTYNFGVCIGVEEGC